MEGQDTATQGTRKAWYSPEVEELGDVDKVTLFDDGDLTDGGTDADDS